MRSLQPLTASCNCPDFLRNSLGLCKHVLAVVGNLTANKNVWEKAKLEESRVESTCYPCLSWDPIRPSLGTGELLTRIGLDTGGDSANERDLAFWTRKYFRKNAEGSYVLKAPENNDPKNLLALVENLIKLQAFLKDGKGAAWQKVEPAVDKLLKETESGLNIKVQAAKALRGFEASLKHLKVKLYSYQVEGVKRFL